MRRLLVVLGVVALFAGLSVNSFAQEIKCLDQTRTSIRLARGCHQLEQTGQQECLVAKVQEYERVLANGGYWEPEDSGVVFFVDQISGALLAYSSVNNNGKAVGCFPLTQNMDVYAVFLDSDYDDCPSQSNDLPLFTTSQPIYGCGPSD